MARRHHHVPDAGSRPAWAGASDRMVLGYPRAWIAAAAGATMLAVASTEYGFGVFAVHLGMAHHWGPLTASCAVVAWLACQLAALPACRRRLSVMPAKAAVLGAVCCALGLLFIGRIADPAGALAVDVVTAGTGSGLVYGTCIAVVAGWFPGRRMPAGLVSAAFACGLIPVAVSVAAAGGQAAPRSALAWTAVTVTALCAPLLREAPRRWWPSGAKSLNHIKESRRNSR